MSKYFANAILEPGISLPAIEGLLDFRFSINARLLQNDAPLVSLFHSVLALLLWPTYYRFSENYLLPGKRLLVFFAYYLLIFGLGSLLAWPFPIWEPHPHLVAVITASPLILIGTAAFLVVRSKVLACAILLYLAGGSSNVLGLLIQPQGIVDFLRLKPFLAVYNFNLADVSIVIGLSIVIAYLPTQWLRGEIKTGEFIARG